LMLGTTASYGTPDYSKAAKTLDGFVEKK
jgi:hypothetical protein